MAYKQKLQKIGNSIGIILPKDIRDQLNLKVGTEVFLIRDDIDNNVVISRKEKISSITPEFYELVRKTADRYKSAMIELARK